MRKIWLLIFGLFLIILVSVPSKTAFFIENVLFEVVNKPELKPLLEKFGFEEGVDYNVKNE